MEALAFRDAVIFAKQRGATRVVFETDCQNLIHMWSMENEQRSMIATILREIHDLSTSLVSFSLRFASRVCNLVAHELARQVSSSCVMVVLLQAPSCVQRYLETDCNDALE